MLALNEVTALPVGSVVRDSTGAYWVRCRGGWVCLEVVYMSTEPLEFCAPFKEDGTYTLT